MANRARLFPILPMLALLLMPIVVRAADEPVATAPIPPPLPPSVMPAPASAPASAPTVPKRSAAASLAKPPAQPPAMASRKKAAESAARRKTERKLAAAHRSAHRGPQHAYAGKPERRLQVARTDPPPPPAARPRHYRGAPMPELEAEGPSMPPPWYDWGRPIAAYPYPGPRGPMPPW